MSKAMNATLTYDHSLGMNYTRILDDLIVGSCLQKPTDVEHLEREGVTTVLQLQEDSDLEYFSLDNAPIRDRCAAGPIQHIRHAVRDFDPYSLRRRLPEAVALIAQSAARPAAGTTYIHCTAGLGRAPATALAWMWWFKGIPLDEAYAQLTSLRPCKPRADSIREAAVDLLYGNDPIDVTIALRRRDAGASDVRIAGIDVGWGQSVPLVGIWDRKTPRAFRLSLSYVLRASCFAPPPGPPANRWTGSHATDAYRQAAVGIETRADVRALALSLSLHATRFVRPQASAGPLPVQVHLGRRMGYFHGPPVDRRR